MKVHFGQIYIEAGVNFPFNYLFQRHLSNEISALVTPSPMYLKKYGSEFELMFRISAKKSIQENEIRGPAIFRKAKDIEYTIFLPYDVIMCSPEVLKSALQYLFQGVVSVFNLIGIDTSKILEKQASLIEQICSDKTMVKEVP